MPPLSDDKVMHGAVPLLQDYLSHSAVRWPDKVALICGQLRLTYREIDDQARLLAAALAELGVRRGDRVLIYADNVAETVISFWATLKAGAIVSLINPQTKSGKLKYLIDDCRPSAVITEANLSQEWRAAVHRRDLAIVVFGPGYAELQNVPGVVPWHELLVRAPAQPYTAGTLDIDLAAIIYTSGSSGDPKGVMLTHRNMLTAATSISTYLGLRRDDIILNVLPLAFDYGLYQMILAFRQGATFVLERSFAYPARTLSLIAAEHVSVFPGVPTIFAMLASLKDIGQYDFSSVRCVTNTAAALALKQIQFLKKTFSRADIFSMYGLTECKRCTYLPPEDLERKPLSVGIAIPNTELWIVDDRGMRVGPNVVGQLVIRGATVMKGYWAKPEATAEKLRPGPLPGEYVLYTGDYCRMDEDGYLYFVGRMDDTIKCRGEKVSPREIEAVIVEMEGVKDAAVVGIADEILGQAIKAFVVLESAALVTENDVRRACQRRLEGFMVPQQVVFVPALPTTATGKTSKTGLA
jgi:amino acid adenylation domain-containing protein